MNKTKAKTEKRARRHRRIRAKISGTQSVPRLSVYKSNKYMYAQLIDDEKGHTLSSATSAHIKKGTMMEKAKEVGKEIAKKAMEKKIKKVAFDRGGFNYTGKIKALADAAREGGLIF